MSLRGKNIVITGKLARVRAAAEEAAKASGATIQKSVTKKTEILVCGIGVGQNKISDAAAKGVETWTEEQFDAACSGAVPKVKGAPPTKKRKAISTEESSGPYDHQYLELVQSASRTELLPSATDVCGGLFWTISLNGSTTCVYSGELGDLTQFIKLSQICEKHKKRLLLTDAAASAAAAAGLQKVLESDSRFNFLSEEKDHGTEAKASAHRDKMLKVKIKKGFVEGNNPDGIEDPNEDPSFAGFYQERKDWLSSKIFPAFPLEEAHLARAALAPAVPEEFFERKKFLGKSFSRGELMSLGPKRLHEELQKRGVDTSDLGLVALVRLLMKAQDEGRDGPRAPPERPDPLDDLDSF